MKIFGTLMKQASKLESQNVIGYSVLILFGEYMSDLQDPESLSSQEAIMELARLFHLCLSFSASPSSGLFVNSLIDDSVITTSALGIADDWISLQWIRHSGKQSRKVQKGPFPLANIGWFWIGYYEGIP